jgi:16S rRNA A1518/A1519 N6-dimethyltransferase RsmA/KsgA/DIM1 with predicted DNA glycosylase/AP lyase activity
VDAAELASGDTVVGIGPGPGDLTEAIAEQATRVVAVEVDGELLADLRLPFAVRPHGTIDEDTAWSWRPPNFSRRRARRRRTS